MIRVTHVGDMVDAQTLTAITVLVLENELGTQISLPISSEDSKTKLLQFLAASAGQADSDDALEQESPTFAVTDDDDYEDYGDDPTSDL